MVNERQESTNIRVSLKTKAELESRGSYNETMDHIIQKLIYKADNGRMSVEQTKKDKIIGKKLW